MSRPREGKCICVCEMWDIWMYGWNGSHGMENGSVWRCVWMYGWNGMELTARDLCLWMKFFWWIKIVLRKGNGGCIYRLRRGPLQFLACAVCMGVWCPCFPLHLHTHDLHHFNHKTNTFFALFLLYIYTHVLHHFSHKSTHFLPMCVSFLCPCVCVFPLHLHTNMFFIISANNPPIFCPCQALHDVPFLLCVCCPCRVCVCPPTCAVCMCVAVHVSLLHVPCLLFLAVHFHLLQSQMSVIITPFVAECWWQSKTQNKCLYFLILLAKSA